MRSSKIDIEKETECIYELLLNRKYDRQKYLRYSLWRKIINYHFPNITQYYIRKIFYYMVINGYFEVSCLEQKKHSYKVFNPQEEESPKEIILYFD